MPVRRVPLPPLRRRRPGPCGHQQPYDVPRHVRAGDGCPPAGTGCPTACRLCDRVPIDRTQECDNRPVPPRRPIRSCARSASRASCRARRRSRRRERAVLLGAETTPLRWFQTCRVTQTSRAPQVATTVLTTLLITMGNASHEPANVHRKATIACISVNAMISTARTADLRTGSGIRRRDAGSSTHNGRYPDQPRGVRSPSVATSASSSSAVTTRVPSGISRLTVSVRPPAGMSRSRASGPRRALSCAVVPSSSASRRSAVPITVSLPTAADPLPASEDPVPQWLPGLRCFTPPRGRMRLLWPIPSPIPVQKDERGGPKIPGNDKNPANWPEKPAGSLPRGTTGSR